MAPLAAQLELRASLHSTNSNSLASVRRRGHANAAAAAARLF
jgi:hypothetical protein